MTTRKTAKHNKATQDDQMFCIADLENFADISKKYKHLTKKSQKYQDEIKSLDRVNDKMQHKIHSLTQALSNTSDDRDAAKAKYEKSKKIISRYKHELELLRSENTRLISKNNDSAMDQNLLVEKTKEVKRLENDLKIHKDRIIDLEQLLDIITNEMGGSASLNPLKPIDDNDESESPIAS